MSFNTRRIAILLALSLCMGGIARAQEFSSTHFSVSNPVIFPGGFASSPSFSLTGVVSQIAQGGSTASTYDLFGGFLYFPFVSTPAVSATPGDAKVNLSWTNANASVGWAVSGYAVGFGPTSGGPYTYVNVGNTLFTIVSPLTNATPYYFVVRVIDALGNSIATSTEVSATPVSSGNNGGNGGSGGGGGGGGGGYPGPTGTAGVDFSGRAYPGSIVVLLKDSAVAARTVAGADARFKIDLAGLAAGDYTFSLYGQDSSGRRSSILSFPVTLTAGITTTIGGIFITPTIEVDKSEVRKGDNIAIFGVAAGSSTVTVQVNSDTPMFGQTKADSDGVYLYNFDTSPLSYGDHSTKAKSAIANEISPYSIAAAFKVGTKNVAAEVAAQTCNTKGDVNNDCKVNLVDFSIVAYWYKRAAPPKNVDINGDGQVTLIDFSIMAFNWTG